MLHSEQFAEYAICGEDYLFLRHFADENDEDGHIVLCVDAGTNLDELVVAAQTHICDEEGER